MLSECEIEEVCALAGWLLLLKLYCLQAENMGGGGGARRVACQGQEVGSVSAARVLSCVLLLHGLMHV